MMAVFVGAHPVSESVGGQPSARLSATQFVGGRSRAIDIVGAHPVSETSRSITK